MQHETLQSVGGVVSGPHTLEARGSQGCGTFQVAP